MAEYSGRDKRLQYLFDAVENVQVDDMTGASASTDGAHGLVPAPLAGDEDKYLKGDGTWAEVQGGGGSSGGSARYKEEVLWEDANGLEFYPSSPQTVLLSDNIRNYDILCFVTSGKNAPTYKNQSLVPASEILNSGTSPFSVVNVGANVYYTTAAKYVDDTHISFVGYSSDHHLYAYKIIGIKWETMQTALIYSTEEREVGVWTDGKPLYQKTIDCGLIINDTSSHDTAHGISDLEKSVYCEGVLIKSRDGEHFVNAYRPSQTAGILVWRTGAYIRYMNNWIGSNEYRLIVTLRYTKTTDTAGSGTWTTTGEYAHHYSTSEKVIGTWIDGSTIYERTWNGLNQSVTANAWNVITGISIANLGIVTDARAYRTSGQGLTGLGVRAFQNSGNSSNNPQIVPLESQTLDTLILQYTKTAS